MTITEYLRKNADSETARFYMPGHKGKIPLHAEFDITEIDGADSLYHADGIIRETERRFERLYGSRTTVLSAGGTTLCIQAMLAAAKRRYGIRKILAARNVHVSFLNACALLDLDPVWIWPEPYDRFGVSGTVTPGQLDNSLKREKVDAVYVTSPDYYGMCSDISGLSAICREYGIPLLVDNAHGAHLKFLPRDLHPVSQGASLCCDGAHKTLPVLTGGALLHAADEFSADDLKSAMGLFGSTSPSYLIMQSLDSCAEYLEKKGSSDFARFSEKMYSLRKAAKTAGWFVFESEPFHLSVAGIPRGWSDLRSYFRENKLEFDYATDETAVFLPSVWNTEKDLDRLMRALSDAAPAAVSGRGTFGMCRPPKRAVSLREAGLSCSEEISIDETCGRIAAENKITCPPGVAVVTAGEIIDEESQNLLKKSGILTIKVLR